MIYCYGTILFEWVDIGFKKFGKDGFYDIP